MFSWFLDYMMNYFSALNVKCFLGCLLFVRCSRKSFHISILRSPTVVGTSQAMCSKKVVHAGAHVFSNFFTLFMGSHSSFFRETNCSPKKQAPSLETPRYIDMFSNCGIILHTKTSKTHFAYPQHGAEASFFVRHGLVAQPRRLPGVIQGVWAAGEKLFPDLRSIHSIHCCKNSHSTFWDLKHFGSSKPFLS